MSGFRRTNGQGTGLSQGTGPRQGGGSKFQPKCPHCIYLNRSLPSDKQLKTDHHMRESPDKNSRFICQVLKSTICENCGAKGHSAFLCKSDDTRHSQFLAKMRREREYNDEQEQPKRVEKAVAVSKNNAFALLDADESSDDEVADTRLQVRKQEKARSMQQQELLRALDTPDADIVVVLESKSWPLAGQKASAMNWADWSDDEDEEESQADMTEELKGWQQVSNYLANGGRPEDWSEQDKN